MTVILKAIDVRKSVKRQGSRGEEFEILHGIDLEASAGEFVSIVGPSGSGKTTLLRCLSGLSRPTYGEVQINGQLLSKLSERKMAILRRNTISYIFQSYNLLPALPAYDNIVLPLQLAHQKVTREAVQQLMNDLQFKADLSQLPAALSGGEQQKVAIARALMMHAKVIFADEPTGALDSISRQVIFARLRALADSGMCVVMVTHDIEQATHTDRAVILHDGRIDAVFNHPTEQALFAAMRESEKVAP
ncbi:MULTISPECIES: ABC transporter ATP-binding protein [Lacticaseibacillus]|uniref:ABC transporter ATP-binding protein n=1 Tax=Lacticaseibacillus zeae subsp. silagei TaxID=3068307 RepID=A0ABD7Z6R7_LACZE|nr:MULTISPECIES: ABC transporter ATP-binding protein [Lacticaseibacillus]OFS00527.1 ABC transporter ATP-binding protein [Lactobacillus sp. HMSC068F07]MDE3282828.1 ABC transporter ATP-binding protein [Lacticaseibacillus casei]MDE3315628.1 ABC transporter ATP-binding protein [Lacticaseibacillus zeae]WLV82687.1 ABC transporter ATP-binding protein [Lacticaseibacillus sp. NCIMB 15475]WLV87483.1 ABC transporter ATP-binding protein [Lacticaseibacillus sp. NCIMB 15474]